MSFLLPTVCRSFTGDGYVIFDKQQIILPYECRETRAFWQRLDVNVQRETRKLKFILKGGAYG